MLANVPEPSVCRQQPKKVRMTRSCPGAPATVERDVPALSGLKRKKTQGLGVTSNYVVTWELLKLFLVHVSKLWKELGREACFQM